MSITAHFRHYVSATGGTRACSAVNTTYGNCIQFTGAACSRVTPSTSNTRGRSLMRQTKRLLSFIGILLIAACTDNGIFNPLNNAAGTYTLTVYAGKTP